MLDTHFIRENLAAVKANCKNRNVTADVDRVVTTDEERKCSSSGASEIQ